MKFKQEEKTIEYKNRWHNKTNEIFFIRNNPYVFRKDIGMIIKVSDVQYDYLINGIVIAQRVGASEEILDNFIHYWDKIKYMSNNDLWSFELLGKMKKEDVYIQNSLF